MADAVKYSSIISEHPETWKMKKLIDHESQAVAPSGNEIIMCIWSAYKLQHIMFIVLTFWIEIACWEVNWPADEGLAAGQAGRLS